MGDLLFYTVAFDFDFDVLAVEHERQNTVHGVSARNRRFVHRRRDKCFGRYGKSADAEAIDNHARTIMTSYRKKYDEKYAELDALREQEKIEIARVLGPPLSDERAYQEA